LKCIVHCTPVCVFTYEKNIKITAWHSKLYANIPQIIVAKIRGGKIWAKIRVRKKAEKKSGETLLVHLSAAQFEHQKLFCE
jgi:hypothetical protein